ncbi:MAG: glycosyltransferase family 1 protein [Bacteroidota bacterium]
MMPYPKIKLHIVALDIPYPLDYGAAIDMYYRIRYLQAAGAEIYLHCFQYHGRQASTELNKWCKEVYYYPRKSMLKSLPISIPYTIYSRRDDLLLKRLQEVDAPILFEGVHTSYYKSHPSLKNRIKVIRNHNIEHDYFRQLGQKAKNPIKKLFYMNESRLLKKYEYNMQDIQAFLPITTSDYSFFKQLYPDAKYSLTPPFHSFKEVSSLPGIGSYCLFHGNLGHPENIEVAIYIVKEVFSGIDVPVIIAGRDPSPLVIEACASISNCKLVVHPSTEDMEELIKEAQVQVMLTFQPTGMKTKLLLSLFCGRHILANEPMLYSTGLESTCTIANTSQQMQKRIIELMSTPFTQADIDARIVQLRKYYDTATNAAHIIKLLQPISL